MNFQTLIPLSHERKSAADATSGSIQTFAVPKSASAVLVTVETTSARVTLDGTDPSAASAPSIVLVAAAAPVLLPIGPGATIKHVSTAGTASILQLVYLQ